MDVDLTILLADIEPLKRGLISRIQSLQDEIDGKSLALQPREIQSRRLDREALQRVLIVAEAV